MSDDANCAAVHTDKGPRRTIRSLVNRARNQFLAGSGLTGNENCGVRRATLVTCPNT